MVKKAFKQRAKDLFGVLSLASALTFGSVNSSLAQGQMELVNYAKGNIGENLVTFYEGGSDDTGPGNPPGNYLDIYYLAPSSNKYNNAGVEISQAKTYNCPLKYAGTIPNGTTNDITFQIVSPFSANAVITSMGTVSNSVFFTDILKSDVTSSKDAQGYFHFPLPIISNAVNGQVYGNVQVNIAPIETSITNFSRNADGTVKLEGKARPGTVLWPEYSTNLLNSGGWTTISNQTKYIQVTTNNFGGFEGFSYTNLPATNGVGFYRIGCDSYNSGTSNLLAQSEAAFGLVEKKSSLESVVEKTSEPKNSFRILKQEWK
jgi:hypothetical protein